MLFKLLNLHYDIIHLDDFLHIPKLALDRKNWVIYKDWLALSVQAHGLGGHLDGTNAKPTKFAVTQAPANRALTDEEKEKITMFEEMVLEGSHCLAASHIYDPRLTVPQDSEKANG
jgi:hypothetical protein